ncbi:hypothetical protein Fot_03400 [Forsythia ovata]|uniref:Uncharacterized protein n=1 Tax=Forsythia ovata TaxID=205694 RepID=A0ABD1X9L3_9LAMI
MKTLSILQQTPLHITKTTPWRRSNPFHHQLHLKNPQNWRLHAGAKGFGGASSSANIQQQPKNKQKPVAKSYRKTNEDEDDKIPDAVWERMISRILFYVGLPLIMGFALLQILGALKEQKLWDVPNWVPFLTSFLTFGSSALGIAYGTLSTSWDIEKEGSFLGFEQAQRNWGEMWKEEDENNG